MEGFWPIFFLAVVLKIPVACLLYLVYWAVKQTPEPEEAPEAGEDHGFRRWRPQPKRPAVRAAAATAPTRSRLPAAQPRRPAAHHAARAAPRAAVGARGPARLRGDHRIRVTPTQGGLTPFMSPAARNRCKSPKRGLTPLSARAALSARG